MIPTDKSLKPDVRRAAKVGRPRRGTEVARGDVLTEAAAQVFLRDGYGAASIDKVAHEAGVSTRTIYERFKNKGDLLVSVITRLVERDMAIVLATSELERLELREALVTIGRAITGRASDPQAAALFRIVAAEAHRFPTLAEQMRASTKYRVINAVATYFRSQIACGRLTLADPDRAASLFTQMVCAELHECFLFRSVEEIAKVDFVGHVNHVVDLFLYGATPRATAGS